MLVTVKKTGQPTLRILASSLEQHVKLGWRHVEDEVETKEVVETPKPEKPKADTLKLKA